MDTKTRIEKALDTALSRADTDAAPPKLTAAMRHAVFPGGARVRPQLSLAVAMACGDPDPSAATGMAAAVELLHCASLVHDDLPCFDNADQRRGRPTVHAVYGEELAVLAGDALIVMAFDVAARGAIANPHRIGSLISALTRAVGAPSGIVAGQGWESEDDPDLRRYHSQKTGALFVGATVGGALAAGHDPAPWRILGDKLGEAYQVADDLADAMRADDEIGKPCGQDAKNGRPNVVACEGLRGAVVRLEALVEEAALSVPECRGGDALRALVRMQAKRLAPSDATLAAVTAA